MPMVARMPDSSTARTDASGKKYISLKLVIPPFSISAHANRVPSKTKPESTCRGFSRPYVFVEPIHQRQIIRQSAHQRHGRMDMQIDEAWNERVIAQDNPLIRHESRLRFSARDNRPDHPLIDRDGMIEQHRTSGLDRNYPARFQQRIDFYGARSCA